MLVTDTGSVYKFGQDAFGDLESSGTGTYTSSPKLLESLKGIFVVQASIGGKFSAVLSREGQVYTFSWGREARLGHASELTDVEPRLLSGPLENALVVQNCRLLLAIAISLCWPTNRRECKCRSLTQYPLLGFLLQFFQINIFIR